MNVRLVRQYRFEAAHRLPCVGAEHPCGRLHGHSYQVELSLEGPVHPTTGWLMDFGDIDKHWELVRARVDHAVLNDVPGLENPTCEHLAWWVWRSLKSGLPMLCRVAVWETPDARCEVEG